jgi:hypothetical protein
MEIPNNVITTEEEYVDFVEKFVTLLDKQFTQAESRINDENDILGSINSLPALISLVNTVGYLRGQDGMFLNIRPSVDSQQTLYEYEDHFEARLKSLIVAVMQSNLHGEYKKRLTTYFVEARTPDLN